MSEEHCADLTVCKSCCRNLSHQARQPFDPEGKQSEEQLCALCFGLFQPSLEDPRSLFNQLSSLPQFIASSEYDMGNLCLSASISTLMALRLHLLFPHKSRSIRLADFLHGMRRSLRDLVVSHVPIDFEWIEEAEGVLRLSVFLEFEDERSSHEELRLAEYTHSVEVQRSQSEKKRKKIKPPPPRTRNVLLHINECQAILDTYPPEALASLASSMDLVPCLRFSFSRESYYVMGRYWKRTRTLSQTPFFVGGPSSERKSEEEEEQEEEEEEGKERKRQRVEEDKEEDRVEEDKKEDKEEESEKLASIKDKFARKRTFVVFKDGERVGQGSVEERIVVPFHEHLRPHCIKFSSSGREDVDVRMLGNGRPFSLEITDAKKAEPTEEMLRDFEKQINPRGEGQPRGDVTVGHLQVVSQDRVGSHVTGILEDKKKAYCALVYVSEAVEPQVLMDALDSREDLVIRQKTPLRVAHRRPMIVREKVIHRMKTVPLNGKFFLLYLLTSAGLYIKEFVTSDVGRTSPSVGELIEGVVQDKGGGSISGMSVDILQLDVVGHMDAHYSEEEERQVWEDVIQNTAPADRLSLLG